jgi:hypothetical protein
MAYVNKFNNVRDKHAAKTSKLRTPLSLYTFASAQHNHALKILLI